MNHFEQWKQLTSLHLGRQQAKRSHQLMLDLLSLDCGLKPALLLDFSVSSLSDLRSFLNALKLSQLIQNAFSVVSVELDVLIVQQSTFKSCSCERIFSSVTFVDVSPNLDSPQLIPSDSEYLEGTKTCVRKFLEERDCDGTVDLPIHQQGKSCANPSTLFGLFLGYPVVYAYDVSLESNGNCLSMVPLINFVVKGRLCKSFSSVSQLTEHTVWSFSVPEMFVEVVEGKVEAWFRGVEEQRMWCDLFTCLTLERQRVQLPTVCL